MLAPDRKTGKHGPRHDTHLLGSVDPRHPVVSERTRLGPARLGRAPLGRVLVAMDTLPAPVLGWDIIPHSLDPRPPLPPKSLQRPLGNAQRLSRGNLAGALRPGRDLRRRVR